MQDLVGTVIANHFRLDQVIGEGGLSFVFKATDLYSGQPSAVKFLKKGITSNRIEDIFRFRREATLVSELRHPNIVRIYEVGRHDSLHYIAMEFIEGSTLAEINRQGVPMDPEDALSIVMQIAETLAYVHSVGVIHRDIKPGNIMITSKPKGSQINGVQPLPRQGPPLNSVERHAGDSAEPWRLPAAKDRTHVKILDFGLSQVVRFERLKGHDAVSGTFSYMSPEQSGILLKPVDGRSDLYSLGILFYELITGTLPFKGDDAESVAHQQIALNPVAPSLVRQGVTPVLERMVLKLLSKDPNDRYQTAQGLVHDLRRYREGETLVVLGREDRLANLTYRTRFIGRKKEFTSLGDRLNEASECNGRACFISGEAGQGKSRLISEMRGLVYERGGIFISGKCFHQENKVPYQPFSEALTDYLNQIKYLSPQEASRRIRRIRESAGEQAEIVCRLNPEIKEVLGEIPPPVPLDPEKETRRFVMACARFFLNLGEPGKPVVLSLDDLQWSDEDSLSLLQEILEDLDHAALLVLVAFRDDEIGEDHRLKAMIGRAREEGRPLHLLHLGRFDEFEVRQLVGQVLVKDTDRVADIGDFIYRKSKGNVLYVLQIIRQLVEEKVLRYRDGEWVLNRERLERVSIPLTMLEAVRHRIKTLDEDHADLLSVASVLGTRFNMDHLYALVDAPPEKVIQWVDDAMALQLLDKAPTRGETVFVHDQIRDAFYQRLEEAQRRRLHGKAALVIEAGEGRETRARAFALAHHFFEAGDLDKCLEYALPAGDEARRNYANEEATRYYTTALRILEQRGETGTPRWIRAKEGLIDVCSTVGRNDAAIDMAGELLNTASSPLEQARLHRLIGLSHYRKSDYGRAEEHLSRGLSLLGRKLPKTRWAVGLSILKEFMVHNLCLLLPAAFLNRRSESVGPETLETAQLYQACTLLYVFMDYVKFFYATLKLMNLGHVKLGKSRELAGALLGYAMACSGMRRFRRSLNYQHRAMAMNRELGNESGVAECLRFMGFTYLMMCDHDRAEKAFEAAREKFLSMGDLYELTHALNGLNVLYFTRTDPAKRDEVVNTMLSVSRKINNHWGIGIALTSLGGTHLIRGDLQAAEEWLVKAQDFSRQNRIWISLCMAHAIHSQVLLEKQDLEGAVKQVDLAFQVEREHSMIKPIVSIVFIYRAEAHLERLKSNLTFMGPAERKEETRKLRGMIKDMRRQTEHWPTFKGLVLRTLAGYYSLSGRDAKARRFYLESIRQMESIDRWFELGKSHFQLGQFLKDRGSDEEARKHWIRAFDLFKKVGAQAYEKRTAALVGIPSEASADPAAVADSRRFRSLLHVSREISSILDIDELLNRIVAKAAEVTGARHGGLFIVHEQSGKLELRIQYSIEEHERASWSYSRSIVDKVFRSGETVLATNASQNADLRSYLSVVDYQLKSILALPIRRQETTLGVCYLDNPLTCGVFTREDADLLEAFMAQCAVCIENARAYERIRSLNAELAKEGEKIKEENIQLKKLARLNAGHIRSFGGVSLVTQDPRMLALMETAERYGQATANVLITGESGVGKEIFAHLIHLNSDRKNKAFVKVNCSAIPESLFESEFFGYEKGAFTGAVKMKKGKFELADGGTLFLDEVGDFPPAQQAKLLRILEDGEITRVGGDRPVKVDVKVLSATNKDLAERVKEGSFREDLYFRLNVLHLHIPPLREHRHDIPLLAAYFLSQVANQEGDREKYFDDPALIYLQQLELPGNVRELKNLVHRAYLCTGSDVVTRQDIEQCRLEEQSVSGKDTGRGFHPGLSGKAEGLFETTISLKAFKELTETEFLSAQLKKHQFNVSQTARSLEVQPSALFRKLKSLNIKVDRSFG